MSDVIQFPQTQTIPRSDGRERLMLCLPSVILERLNAASLRMKCAPDAAGEAFIIWALARFEGKSLLEFTRSLNPDTAIDAQIVPLPGAGRERDGSTPS